MWKHSEEYWKYVEKSRGRGKKWRAEKNFRRINLDHPDTVFEEILMNRRQGETYCGDLRGDTGAEERTRRGCHVVEEEN